MLDLTTIRAAITAAMFLPVAVAGLLLIAAGLFAAIRSR
jgi:hypothetical protein